MDQRQIANLTPEDQERFKSLEELFASDGWGLFMEHLSGLYARAQDQVLMAETWEANRVATGELRVLHSVLSIEDATETEFASMADDGQTAEEEGALEGELVYE